MNEITPEEGMRRNRENWDARVPVHLEAYSYNEAFKRLQAGGHNLSSEIVEEVRAGVGDVAGRSLVHLMCHIGLDTLSWARLGADVTGVDFSEPAIETARGFSRDLGLPAEFVWTNLYDAATVLDRTYDIVFTSEGVLCWLPDLNGWARVIADLLTPGGTFYLMEGHPFSQVFDDADVPDGIAIKYSYFDRQALPFGPGPSYAGPEKTLPANVEWMHPMSAVLNALIDAGLVIQRVEEHPTAFFQQFKVMEGSFEEGHDLPGDLRGKLPMRFSVRAIKP
ncbi:MAG: class I SAM-dependent methyltransferase [Planctomycetota bacterium]